MKLHVHVQGKRVAELFCSRGDYVLHYLPEARTEDFVALTMPVRSRPWIWPRELHPFFLQHPPEEPLLSAIRARFGSRVDGTDLFLLRLLGATSANGRVVLTPVGGALGHPSTSLDVERLLDAGDALECFGELAEQYLAAVGSDIASQLDAPEFSPSTETARPTRKACLRTKRYVVKASGSDTPFLGFNEYHSMRVMARLEVVPVANVQMSVDGTVLVAERFDVDAQGRPLYGVEDACSLLGLPPSGKYRPSMQQVLDATEPYIEPAKRGVQREHIGWLLLVNAIFQSADWHAKHIALLYTDQTDIEFAPIYDLMTTAAYPALARRAPGLSVDGRRGWPSGKVLQSFFKVRLGISAARYTEMIERICESVIEVRHEIVMAARNEPLWHDLARGMVHSWDDGMAGLWRPKKPISVRGQRRRDAS